MKINGQEKVQVQEKDSKKNYKTKKNYFELSDEFFLEKSIEVSFHTNIKFQNQNKEDTSDEIYLKYHNFFEKKEVEFRNKINLKFRTRKIQNVTTTIKKEDKLDFYKDKDENEDDNIIIKEDYHPNIIKIIL